VAAEPWPEIQAAPRSTAFEETCNALALTLRDGDVEAAQRLFSFVVDQLPDRRCAVTDVLTPMLLGDDASWSIGPMTNALHATCSAFLANLREPVARSGQRSVLLYAWCGGAQALLLHLAAILLDEARVPATLQFGSDVGSFARAAASPGVGAVALAASDPAEYDDAAATISRLKRAGVSVLPVDELDPAALADSLLRLRGPLSCGEATVLRFASMGFTNVRIAHELDISVSAVKSRLESCFAKLGALDRAHAVAIALRQRWIA
jgi:DNA-binding CsgD family transcriptional regulator